MHQLLFILIALVGFSPAMAQDLSSQRPKRLAPHTPVKKTAPEAQNSADVSTWDKVESWNFQFGTHTEYFNAVQTDTSGTRRKFDLAPTVGLGMKFALAPAWRFLPEANWVLPIDSGSSNVIRNLFMFRADVGYDLLDWLRLRVGTSLMWLNMHGKGGKTKINNGSGQSTFYNPDENRSALNNTLDFGAEGFFNDEWSARLQTYIYSLLQEERRQVSYTLFLTYHWK